MWRWLTFLILLCVAVVAIVWFVQNPGDVRLQWRDWRLDTSVGVLLAVVVIVSVLVALVYRFWRFLRRAPAEIGGAMRTRRRNKGYEALGSGMVAVAAGDPAEARRNARRAESMLAGVTPLTRLLSAQSAQLDGDEKAAERFFTEMLDDPETRFLGLRGLLTQAIKTGSSDRALQLAADAHAMRPKSEWVATTLFDLQSGEGNWVEAERITEEMLRHRLIGKSDADRRRAVFCFEKARAAEKNGDRGGALGLLKRAVDLAPDLTPATVALMRRFIGDGHHRKAATLAERVWAKAPHPDLVDPYLDARRATEGLARVKAAEKLTATNKDHLESHIAKARVAIQAKLWGEARKHLGSAGVGEGPEPSARVCRMMAELEEHENGDLAKAREWLVRAAAAPADPQWVCGSCGNAVTVWTPHCGNCKTFDGYSWGPPPHIAGLPALAGADAPEAESSSGLPATTGAEGAAALPSRS